MPVQHVPLGSASVFAKDGHLYTKLTNHSFHTTTFTSATHPLASFQNGLACTLFQQPTSQALLTSPTNYQREFVCGACINTAQVGALLAAPLDFLFKQSSLRSLRDIMIVFVT